MNVKRCNYFPSSYTSQHMYIYAYFFDKTDFYPELTFFMIATYSLLSYINKLKEMNENNIRLNIKIFKNIICNNKLDLPRNELFLLSKASPIFIPVCIHFTSQFITQFKQSLLSDHAAKAEKVISPHPSKNSC